MNQSAFNWRAIGPSGGGQTLAVTISPHNSNTIFLASDMGGIYRSLDGGKTFELLNGHAVSRLCSDSNHTAITFHPIRRNEVYIGVWNGLVVSKDNGQTFTYLNNHGMPHGPSRIVFDESGEKGFLAYNDLTTQSTYLKDLEGNHMFSCKEISLGLALYKNTVVLCTKKGLYISNDFGHNFVLLIDKCIFGFCHDENKVYFTSANELYSIDMCDSKVQLVYHVNNGCLEHVASCKSHIYVGFRGSEKHFDGDDFSSIHASHDGGKTFEACLFIHPANKKCNVEGSWVSGVWGWYLSPSCISVTPADENVVIYTNFTGMGISKDGGKTFREASAGFDGTHIQVMTSWDYIIDPHDKTQHYIAMTDFSGWRSSNSGKEWEHAWIGNPWKSNIYAIAPHPTIKGRLLAATSTVHDLPYWHWLRRQNSTWSGGIIQSNDYGKTWFPQDQTGTGPFGVVTDIKYYKNKVYAALLGQGLYVSNQDETYWKLLDVDIQHANVAKINICDDKLYVVVWPQQTENGIIPGAIYYSEDGDKFKKLSLSEDIKYPVHVSVMSEKEIYVSCFDCIDYAIKGRKTLDLRTNEFGKPGLYRTKDKGQNWEMVYDGSVYSTTVSQEKVYICSRENGLLVLENDNLSQYKDLPVINPHTVTIDDSGNLYVTSFGQGVYKGTLLN